MWLPAGGCRLWEEPHHGAGFGEGAVRVGLEDAMRSVTGPSHVPLDRRGINPRQVTGATTSYEVASNPPHTD